MLSSGKSTSGATRAKWAHTYRSRFGFVRTRYQEGCIVEGEKAKLSAEHSRIAQMRMRVRVRHLHSLSKEVHAS
jgi:hypothetical protein